MSEMTANTQYSVTMTDAAVARVAAMLAEEEQAGLALRIAAQPGGCSGLQYQLMFDDQRIDGDEVQERDGITLLVDKLSVAYLEGAVIDFLDNEQQQGFTIDNPLAAVYSDGCDCGGSCSC